MLENLTAFIAPKSFNLGKYLAESKQYTHLKPWLVKRIEAKLSSFDSEFIRSGECATAIACGGTIVKITNDVLAQSLYVIVSEEEFWEKVSSAYSLFENAFQDLKFFVDEKHQKVLYIHYTCSLNFSESFSKNLWDKLQYLCELFSTEVYKINVDYETFFRKSFFENTAFLSSFFTSIIPEEYEFSYERLTRIASMLLSHHNNQSSHYSHPMFPERLSDTIVPGMYVNYYDKYFENTVWPRNICINIHKVAVGKTFSSYAEFFAPYPETEFHTLDGFNLVENFVFDEELLLESLKSIEITNDFITYQRKNNQRLTVTKVKDATLLGKYLCKLRELVDAKFIENVFVVPNSDYSAYYLFFYHRLNKSLRSAIIKADGSKIIQLIASEKWCFNFNQGTNLVECFVTDNHLTKLYLNPRSIAKIDFDAESPLDYRLLIFQSVKTLKEYNAHYVPIDTIYSCEFMKVLPYTFANNLIDYLKTGVYSPNESESWGDILTSEHTSQIVFLESFMTELLPDPYKVFIFPEAVNTDEAKKIFKSTKIDVDYSYTYSLQALDFVKSTGFILSDSTLDKFFPDNNINPFLAVDNVIISNKFSVDGNYKIIGVIWNRTNLRTIDSVIASGLINTKNLYEMMTSLARVDYEYLRNLTKERLGQFLVDKDFNVFLNWNAVWYLKGKKPTSKDKFEHIANVFKSMLGDAMWSTMDHFTYHELVTKSINITCAAERILLCSEHGHYYLRGTLCPKCQKIYELVDYSKCKKIHTSNGFEFYAVDNSTMLMDKTFLSFNITDAQMFRELKLGIEHNLYNQFFFKPLKIAKTGLFDTVLVRRIDFTKLMPLDTFKNVQRLKVILVLYKKLLPYILDGSFISTYPKMFTSIAMHKDYNGEIFILNIPLMECSEVLKADKKEKVALTKKLFADFLVDYITADESLKAAMAVKDSCVQQVILDIQNMNFSEDVIRNCFGSFCEVHKLPISRTGQFCPLCKASGISKDDIVFESPNHFKALEKTHAMYEGGEATLYPYQNGQVQKLFKDNVDLVLKTKILGKALQKAPLFREFNASHSDVQFVTINKVLYQYNGTNLKLEGYTENFIDGSFKISCLRDKEFIQAKGYTRNDVINILIKVCIGIEFLHSIGAYIGDLNGGNILIKNNVVYFIDLDGMSFDDVKNFVYTDTYIYPPSAESKNITKDDDWYSLAIQAFYYLTYSHPFRGVCERRSIPENEIVRMTKGYSVLGNHGIKAPNISVGWHFMPKFLVDFFLDTFEGKKRESMRTVLQSYREISGGATTSHLNFQEVKRSYPCLRALSDNSYISSDSFIVWGENKVTHLGDGNILINLNGKYFTFITAFKTVVLNDNSGQIFTFSAIDSTSLVSALDGNLFYTSTDRTSLYVKSIDATTGKEVTRAIAIATTGKIVNFLASDTNKFVFLEMEDANHYAIYCNSEKLTSVDISGLHNYQHSHILYDQVSGKHLILISGGSSTLGVVIFPNGSYTTFTIPKAGKCNCFFSNTLYYIREDKLWFYNLSTGKNNSMPDCYVTADSLIQRKANKFIICTGAKAYMYVKS